MPRPSPFWRGILQVPSYALPLCHGVHTELSPSVYACRVLLRLAWTAVYGYSDSNLHYRWYEAPYLMSVHSLDKYSFFVDNMFNNQITSYIWPRYIGILWYNQNNCSISWINLKASKHLACNVTRFGEIDVIMRNCPEPRGPLECNALGTIKHIVIFWPSERGSSPQTGRNPGQKRNVISVRKPDLQSLGTGVWSACLTSCPSSHSYTYELRQVTQLGDVSVVAAWSGRR